MRKLLTENNSTRANEWRLKIFSPDNLCTIYDWYDDSNYIFILLQRGNRASRKLKGLERIYKGYISDRRHAFYDYIERISKRFISSEFVSSDMEVQIQSPNTDFFPVFPFFLNLKGDTPTLNRLLEGQPSPSCPVVMIDKDLGVAAFIGRAKCFRNINEEYYDAEEIERAEKEAERLWDLSQTVVVHLLTYGLIISQASFTFTFQKMEGHSLDVTSAKLYKRIFASYAREDREVVESVNSIIQCLGDWELRWDLNVLRSGDYWETSILDEINSADSFQLFWSAYAKASSNVRKEWQHALSLEREHFIKPVYWNEPLPTPPPELTHFHFSYIQLKISKPNKRRSVIQKLLDKLRGIQCAFCLL